MKTIARHLALPAVLAAAPLASAKDLPAVAYEQFATGFTSPLAMLPYESGDEAFVVVDQAGVISFLGEKGGKPGEAFLDLRKRMVKLKPGFDERGVLGLAFHPKFKENKKFYVYYSAPLRDGAPEGFDHTGNLSEFKLKEGSVAGDPASERILLQVDQPQWNHNGGLPAFGPDGFLYLGLGDGGKANDRAPGHEKEGNGQALNRLLGKILRIDVDSGEPYGIPKDNPFVGKEGRDEIYAWGIRNPWGLTFDKGQLIVADVGQGRFEEINVIKNGGNYGWPRYEGFWPFSADNPAEMITNPPSKAAKGFEAPALAYPHNPSFGKAAAFGISVTGGHVYRGKALPDLDGVYVFADWAFSWATSKLGLFAGVPAADGQWTMEVIPGAKTPREGDTMVVGFGTDHDGELYALTNNGRGPSGTTGTVWKIVPGK